MLELVVLSLQQCAVTVSNLVHALQGSVVPSEVELAEEAEPSTPGVRLPPPPWESGPGVLAQRHDPLYQPVAKGLDQRGDLRISRN